MIISQNNLYIIHNIFYLKRLVYNNKIIHKHLINSATLNKK